MRIIAGKWRGTRLAGPGKAPGHLQLRPTPDRLRERLFNMLGAGRWDVDVAGALVLDLFAGTGALGLEALSRGAESSIFVEKSREGGALITENIARCRATTQGTLLARDATRLGPAPSAATLVFLDPPFRRGLGEAALVSAMRQGWLAPEALVLWEESAPQSAPEGFDLIEVLPHGESVMTVLAMRPSMA